MRSLFVVLLLSALHVHAQTSVLFIGNSYTTVNDLPNTMRQLALSLGDTVQVASAAPGGYTLMDHSNAPATLSAITSQQWDYVVLQEQSQFGALPTFEAFTDVAATALTYAIKASSECARPVFYMTWGRENGDASNCLWYPQMCTYESMQQALRDNYIQLALDNEGYVSPVGWAWKHVRDTHPNIELYQADESHPSVAGTYLAACVFYCTLFRESCVGASFTSTLQPDSAAILQAIASATVLDSLDTWNLNDPGSTDATVTSMSGDVWNEVTLHHYGQGEHLWTCSNGQTSTDANPTFTFDTGGTYTFTHVYTDPCGHTDTKTWTFEVYATGIDEHGVDRPRVMASEQGMLFVTGARNRQLLQVFDTQGRMLIKEWLGSPNAQVPCPSGLLLWTLRDADGTVVKGKVVVR